MASHHGGEKIGIFHREISTSQHLNLREKTCNAKRRSWFDFLNEPKMTASIGTIPEDFRGVGLELPNFSADAQPKDEGCVIIADPIPFFLPKRFYTMNGKALWENASSAGQYWADVCALFICQHPNNQFRECNLNLTQRCGKIDANSSPLNLESLKESDEDPLDFLTEPWVLVQLPFQPTLLHQWLATLVAEYLKFEKMQADTFHHYLALSRHLKVRLAKSGVDEVRAFAECSLTIGRAFLTCAYANSATQGENFSVRDFWRELTTKAFPLAEVLKTIDKAYAHHFFENSIANCDCYLGNDSLKVLNYDSKNGVEPFADHLNSAFILPILGLGFISSKAQKEIDLKLENFSAVNWDRLADFIETSILKTGRLKEVTKSQIVKHVKNEMILTSYLKHVYFSALEKSIVQSKAEAIMDTTLALYCKAQTAHSVNEITAYLHSLIFPCLIRTPTTLCINELDHKISGKCPMFLSAAYRRNPMKAPTDDFHTAIWSQLDKKCKSQQLTTKWPSLKYEEGVVTVIKGRIRSLVLKMAKRLLYEKGGEKLPPDFYSEWTFVQFVLPCFGASFLELQEDASVDVEKKKWFLYFIHRLLCSYQKNPRYPNDKYKPHLVHREGFVFTAHKPQQITSILSRAIFGSNDQNLITRDFFSKFLFPLTHFCARKEAAATRESLHFFFFRLEAVLRRCLSPEFFLEPGPDPVKSATTLCRMVAATAFRSRCYKDEPDFENLPTLLKVVFKNHLAVNKNTWLHKTKTNKMQTEAQTMSEKQLLQLIFYLCFKTPHFKETLKKQAKSREMERELSLDLVEKAFWSYLEADAWRIKQIFSTWMSRIKSKEGDQLPEVPMKFATDLAPYCFSPALSDLAGNHRVKMEAPGEITFFPVRHCRWCGVVQAEQFRVCKLCVEHSDYPDTSVFCSPKCEEEALNGEHTEEHARYLKIRCGLIKP